MIFTTGRDHARVVGHDPEPVLLVPAAAETKADVRLLFLGDIQDLDGLELDVFGELSDALQWRQGFAISILPTALLALAVLLCDHGEDALRTLRGVPLQKQKCGCLLFSGRSWALLAGSLWWRELDGDTGGRLIFPPTEVPLPRGERQLARPTKPVPRENRQSTSLCDSHRRSIRFRTASVNAKASARINLRPDAHHLAGAGSRGVSRRARG